MDIAFLTDIGHRPTNEDCLMCKELSPKRLLIGVLDGCGSAAGAAAIVRDKLLEYILNNPCPKDSTMIEKQLKASVVAANNYLVDYRLHNLNTGCCVITLCIIDWDSRIISIAHCGDTRAYLLSEEGLALKTKDDSYIGTLLQAGCITESESKTHPLRHQIFKSIGSEYLDETNEEYISAWNIDFEDKNSLLLCTDGIYDPLLEYDIRYVLEKDTISTQDKLNMLLTLAREAGSTDNATAILINL